MVSGEPVEQSKGTSSSSILPKSAQEAMVAPNMGIRSDSTTSAQSGTSGTKDDVAQVSVARQDANYSPADYYSYHYPGDLSFSQFNDGRRDHQSMGARADQGSVAYYTTGNSPYYTSTKYAQTPSLDQNSHGNTSNGSRADQGSVAYYTTGNSPYYTSTKYAQTPSLDQNSHGNTSNGSRADQGSVAYYTTGNSPYYTSTKYAQTPSLDKNSPGNTSNGSNTTNGATVKSSSSPSLTKRTNGIKPSQLYDFLDTKTSSVSSNSRQTVASSNFSQPKLNKLTTQARSYHQTEGYVRRTSGNCQHSSYQRHDLYGNHCDMSYKSNVRTWNDNDRPRPSKITDFESSSELKCGPRVHTEKLLDSSEKAPLTLGINKDRYNLADFETDYEAAKFYVIKSYSEDDVHKSIMYNVWSSTVHGNKKLDAAFHDTESIANEAGKKCPMFLFFSVNGSGQFVGVAEMVGKIDYNKTMDFWQMDKWTGFFPLKWHIVKDVPNAQLRHIILENNDNRPVTYTRDTQEIRLKQGLEMLKIFKSYSSKTSLLDDLDFYESRAKALEKRQSSNSGSHNHTDIFAIKDLPKQMHGKRGEANSVSAIVNLTNNLSLNNRAR